MDNSLRSLIKKNNLLCSKITIKNNTKIINTPNGIYVFKKKVNKNIDDIYKYLYSRAFDYFSQKIDENEEYEVYEYIEDANTPNEQKALDIMYVLSLLHSKTTYYKEIDFDYYKKIYEDTNYNLEYLYNYYNNLINAIEKEVYMSPAHYLLARNISTIFKTISFCQKSIEKWYQNIQDKTRMRQVIVHNNIDIEHILKKDKPYLISWNKSKTDMPIYDLIVFYKKHYLDFDFIDLFHTYESRYTLLEEEKLLLFIFISIPEKLELNDTEYNLCIKISHFFDYLYKTQHLINNYNKPKH